ncbi:MAG: radical SAM protein [Bryobacteraceae bacterium]|nr:radical SAM protein [Bryobacteraceae bacterium]MDW8377333.1 radical SAM protein [Bryobacterales bacterium]
MALVGIAKLAAQASPLQHKRSVDYLQLATRSILNPCSSQRVPFEWTINPYRGCEYGCKYCYARYTHEFMELREPSAFERKIFVKSFQAAVFRRELAAVKAGARLAIGTATDPYQPAERRFRITQQILEILAQMRGLRLSITTKSDLVARDAPILAQLAKSHCLHVSFTVTTMDRRLARLLEPYAPRPDLRLRALRTLREHGIQAGVFASPLLPGLNDSLASLRFLGQSIFEAGASYFGANPLFLRPCSKQVMLSLIEQRFPKLLARYQTLFRRADFLDENYAHQVRKRVEAVRREFRLAPCPEDYLPPEAADPQLSLFEPSWSGTPANAGR